MWDNLLQQQNRKQVQIPPSPQEVPWAQSTTQKREAHPLPLGVKLTSSTCPFYFAHEEMKPDRINVIFTENHLDYQSMDLYTTTSVSYE